MTYMVIFESNLCGRCKGKLIQTELEIVCSKCGFVTEDRFEDNTFDYDERVGAPKTSLYNDMSSVISNKRTDASGHSLKNQNTINRIKLWDSRIKTSPNRNSSRAMTEITRVSDILSIPDNIKQRAAEIYLECEKRRMLRGRTIDVFAISCLYVACREAGLPKTLQSFVGETYSRRTDITAYYRLILKTLDIKTSVQSPIVFIGKIASNVNPPISQAIQRLAQDIINKYDNTAGKDPIGLAAASLYIASMIKGLGMTQRDIALASDVTEVTIRNRFKDLFRCYQEKENNQEINDLTEKLISLQNYFEQTRD